MPETTTTKFSVTPEESGERLDHWLSGRLGIARHQVQNEIKAGLVTVNGVARPASYRMRANDEIIAPVKPPVPPPQLEPSGRELVVHFEDEHLLVLEKPAGLVVLPAPGHREDTLAHALLGRCGQGIEHVGGPGRCGVLHRLDKLTSGLLAVAKTPEAHQALSGDLADRLIQRRYIALAIGRLSPENGEIEAPVGRRRNDRKLMGVVPEGRPSKTGYRTLMNTNGVSLLLLKLFTGRTHQIRVHLQHAGHPVLGDPNYGWTESRTVQFLPAELRSQISSAWPARQMLHAAGLLLRHPVTGVDVCALSPPPADLEQMIGLIYGESAPKNLMDQVRASLETW